MLLLNPENNIGGTHFCVLDYSNSKDVDYRFNELVYIEKYKYPAAVLRIGTHILKVPLDWNVVIFESGIVEIIPIKQLNDRDFSAFVFNPLSDYTLSSLTIEVIGVELKIDWTIPKLKRGHILCVPLQDMAKPPCAYFVGKGAPAEIDIEGLL